MVISGHGFQMLKFSCQRFRTEIYSLSIKIVNNFLLKESLAQIVSVDHTGLSVVWVRFLPYVLGVGRAGHQIFVWGTKNLCVPSGGLLWIGIMEILCGEAVNN